MNEIEDTIFSDNSISNESSIQEYENSLPVEQIEETTQETSQIVSTGESVQTYEISVSPEVLQSLDNINEKIEYQSSILFIFLALISFYLFVKIIYNTFKDFQ